jgi:signal transduction histidine kinase
VDAAAHKSPAPLRWVFGFTVACLYAAAVLRSVLAFDGGQRRLVLVLLLVWLALLFADRALGRRRPGLFVVGVALQCVVIAVLLRQSDSSDYFAVLLAVPVMQAVQRWRTGSAAVLIGLFAALTGACLVSAYGVAQALTFAAVYAGLDVFLGAYALATKRSGEADARNEALAAELRSANERLADHAAQAQRLAAARARQRLARDLHDSVTQTLFSMTLTAQSASLLLRREPAKVAEQLEHFERLAQDALTEMDELAAQPPAPPAPGGLAAALRVHVTQRAAQEGLAATVEVTGEAAPGRGDGLSPDVEQALLRIAQEALNNVAKHAEAGHAVVRLRLLPPRWLEVVDDGRGFDPDGDHGEGVGLVTMRERAAEIGWSLTVTSSPGGGARVLAQQPGDGGRGGDAG